VSKRSGGSSGIGGTFCLQKASRKFGGASILLGAKLPIAKNDSISLLDSKMNMVHFPPIRLGIKRHAAKRTPLQ